MKPDSGSYLFPVEPPISVLTQSIQSRENDSVKIVTRLKNVSVKVAPGEKLEYSS